MERIPWEILASASILIDFCYNHRAHVYKAWVYLVGAVLALIPASPGIADVIEEVEE